MITPLVKCISFAGAPPTRYWRSQPIAGGGAMRPFPHQRAPPHRVAGAPPTRYWRSQPIAGGGAMRPFPHQRAPPHRVAGAPPTRYWRSQPIAGGGALRPFPHQRATPHRVAGAPPTRYWRSQPIAGGGALRPFPHQRAPPHRVAGAGWFYSAFSASPRENTFSRIKKRGTLCPVFFKPAKYQAENDEPQPQVVVAFGFLMTNCDPSSPSL